jgi:hypothetical protein
MAAPETTMLFPRSLLALHPSGRLITLAGREAPRRRVLQGLLSAALGALSSTHQHAPAAANRCKGVGKRCGTDGDCCSAFCEPLSRQCVARCTEGSGICGTEAGLAPCAPGCSCYFVELDGTAGRACLHDPAGGTTTLGQECPGTEQCAPNVRNRGGCPCSSPADCPKGYLCTASSCCQPDSVCLPLCEPVSA